MNFLVESRIRESPEQTCRREIYEEVGIGLKEWHPFDIIRHEYEDVIVNLHLFRYTYLRNAQSNSSTLDLVSTRSTSEFKLSEGKCCNSGTLIWSHFLIKISDQIDALPHHNFPNVWRIQTAKIEQIGTAVRGFN